MTDITKIAIRASTQDHLDIEDIKDDLVILKDGGACLVIETTAINFDLLSEKEQEATIFAYAGLLNSLTFPIQIVIRSQRKDISSYLHLLEEAEAKAPTDKIREQISKYRDFIHETVQKNEVLDKKFYIVIPLSSLEVDVTRAFKTSFGGRKKAKPDIGYILQKAKLNLFPKRDHLLRLLNRLGLKGRQLNTQELIQLFFNIYNPEVRGQIVGQTADYTTPMIQAETSSAPAASLPSSPPAPPTAQEKPKTEESIQDQIKSLVRETSQASKEEKPVLPA